MLTLAWAANKKSLLQFTVDLMQQYCKGDRKWTSTEINGLAEEKKK